MDMNCKSKTELGLPDGTLLFIEKDESGVIRVTGRQILHNLTDFELLIKIDDFETSDWNFNIKPNETKSVVLENELVRAISVGLVIGGKTVDSTRQSWKFIAVYRGN